MRGYLRGKGPVGRGASERHGRVGREPIAQQTSKHADNAGPAFGLAMATRRVGLSGWTGVHDLRERFHCPFPIVALGPWNRCAQRSMCDGLHARPACNLKSPRPFHQRTYPPKALGIAMDARSLGATMPTSYGCGWYRVAASGRAGRVGKGGDAWRPASWAKWGEPKETLVVQPRLARACEHCCAAPFHMALGSTHGPSPSHPPDKLARLAVREARGLMGNLRAWRLVCSAQGVWNGSPRPFGRWLAMDGRGMDHATPSAGIQAVPTACGGPISWDRGGIHGRELNPPSRKLERLVPSLRSGPSCPQAG